MAVLDIFKYKTVDNVGEGGVQRRETSYASDNYMKLQKETEITNLKREIQTVENDLDAAYIQIGRRFMEKAERTNDYCGLEIQDILRVMQPKIERKRELDRQLVMTEKSIREIDILREKEKADLEFQDEKSKLDKALAMDVLTQQEYDQRLNVAKKKAYNFEEIRRVNQQFDMKLITEKERDERIKLLTT